MKEKIYIATCYVPTALLGIVWLLVAVNFKGYSAFGGVLYLVIPLLLCVLYFLIGIGLLVWKKVYKKEKVSKRLILAVAISSIAPILMVLRERYLDFQTWSISS